MPPKTLLKGGGSHTDPNAAPPTQNKITDADWSEAFASIGVPTTLRNQLDALQKNDETVYFRFRDVADYHIALKKKSAQDEEGVMKTRGGMSTRETMFPLKSKTDVDKMGKVLHATLQAIFDGSDAYFQSPSDALRDVVDALRAAHEKAKAGKESFHTHHAILAIADELDHHLPFHVAHEFFAQREKELCTFGCSQALDIVWPWVAQQLAPMIQKLLGIDVLDCSRKAERDFAPNEETPDAFKDEADLPQIPLEEQEEVDQAEVRRRHQFEQMMAGFRPPGMAEQMGGSLPKLPAPTTYRGRTARHEYTNVNGMDAAVKVIVVWELETNENVEENRGDIFEMEGRVYLQAKPTDKKVQMIGIIGGDVIGRCRRRREYGMLQACDEDSNCLAEFAVNVFNSFGHLRVSLRDRKWGRCFDQGHVFLMRYFHLDSSVRGGGLSKTILSESLPEFCANEKLPIPCIMLTPFSAAKNSEFSKLKFKDTDTCNMDPFLYQCNSRAATEKISKVFCANGFARLCDGSEYLACVPFGLNLPPKDGEMMFSLVKKKKENDGDTLQKQLRKHPVWNQSVEANYGNPHKRINLKSKHTIDITARIDGGSNLFDTMSQLTNALAHGVPDWYRIQPTEQQSPYIDRGSASGIDQLCALYLINLPTPHCTCGQCRHPIISNRTVVALGVQADTIMDMLRDGDVTVRHPNLASSTQRWRTAAATISKLFQKLLDLSQSQLEQIFGGKNPSAKALKALAQSQGIASQTAAFFDAGSRVEDVISLIVSYSADITFDEQFESCFYEEECKHFYEPQSKSDAEDGEGSNDDGDQTEDCQTTAKEAVGAEGEAQEMAELGFENTFPCERDFLWHELVPMFYDDGYVPRFQNTGQEQGHDDAEEWDDDSEDDEYF